MITEEQKVLVVKLEQLATFKNMLKAYRKPVGGIPAGDLSTKVQELLQKIDALNVQENCPRHVFLTQDAYDALETKDPGTLYFIVEDIEEPETPDTPVEAWVFGSTFPIILS